MLKLVKNELSEEIKKEISGVRQEICGVKQEVNDLRKLTYQTHQMMHQIIALCSKPCRHSGNAKNLGSCQITLRSDNYQWVFLNCWQRVEII